MSLTDYENAEKWLNFFRRLPWHKKLAFLAILFVFVALPWYQTWSLSGENEELKKTVRELRSDKGTLVDENRHLTGLLDPLRHQAQQFYPSLELAAALSKLIDDVSKVKAIAAQTQFKPLPESATEEIKARLNNFFPKSPFQRITLQVEQGNSNRLRVSDQLSSLLSDAGFEVLLTPQMSMGRGVPPDILVKFNPEIESSIKDFIGALTPIFINSQWSGKSESTMKTDSVEITIQGEPLFSENGTVSF